MIFVRTEDLKKYFVISSRYSKPYILSRGQSVTIGREKSNPIQIASNTLSRQHAQISVNEKNEAFVEDLASRNGSFLNGIRIQQGPVRLTPGDRLKLGGISIIFEEHIELPEKEEDKKADTTTSIGEWLKSPEQLSSGEVMGNLRYMDMVEILTNINYFQKSGVLDLRQGDKRGVLHFKSGEILTAQFDQLQGLDAIYFMLQQKEGLFSFEQKNLEGERQITLGIQQILMNYAYMLDQSQIEASEETFVMDEFPNAETKTLPSYPSENPKKQGS